MNGTKLVILEIHRHNIVPVPISGPFSTDRDCIIKGAFFNRYIRTLFKTDFDWIPARLSTLALQPKDKEMSAHQQHTSKTNQSSQDSRYSPISMYRTWRHRIAHILNLASFSCGSSYRPPLIVNRFFQSLLDVLLHTSTTLIVA